MVRGAFPARLGELLGHGPVLLVAEPSNRGEVVVARRRRPGLGVARLDVGAFEQVRGGEARGRDGRLHLLDRRLGRSSAAFADDSATAHDCRSIVDVLGLLELSARLDLSE